MPGRYPDPTGTAQRAYWNGHEWGSPPPKPPFNKRVLVIVGSVVGGLLLLGLLGNIGSDHDGASSMTSTVTKTVTVTAQAPTVTESGPPTMSTVTVTAAAPPAPFFEPPAEAPPPMYEEVPPVVPLVPEVPSSAYYGSCAEARAAGAAPLRVGDPGYRSGLDRDGDGVACES